MASDPSFDPTNGAETSKSRVVISLLVFAHLFFVFVAISANLAPSQLQSRILTRFAVYTQLFNFDLDFTPYHLTHGSAEDVDHRIEVLPRDGDAEDADCWHVLPDVGLRGSDRYQRYQRLARMMSYFSQEEEIPALLAQSVGENFLRQRAIQPKQIRCRKHMLQRWDVIRGGTPTQRDPNDATYFQVPYDARCVVSGGRSVSIVKLGEASQVAQPSTERNQTNGSNP